MARRGHARKPGEPLPDQVVVHHRTATGKRAHRRHRVVDLRGEEDREMQEHIQQEDEEVSLKQLLTSSTAMTKSPVRAQSNHRPSAPRPPQRQSSIRDFFSRREDVPAKSERASVETAETDKEKGKRDASVGLQLKIIFSPYSKLYDRTLQVRIEGRAIEEHPRFETGEASSTSRPVERLSTSDSPDEREVKKENASHRCLESKIEA